MRSEYGTDISEDIREITRQSFVIKKAIRLTMLHFLSLTRHKTLLLKEVPNFYGLQEALMHLLVDAESWVEQIEEIKTWSSAKDLGDAPEVQWKEVIDLL